ncbi:MAG TPA: hypothetical protein VFD75_03050 [Pyrinomonadaceae bacterium]|nr:hypothetical protein [Pyrinomonadaceae bacterium]
MNKTCYFFATLVLLCIPFVAMPQNSSARSSSAERSWPTFWRQFTTAVNKKDHAALIKLMPTNFSDDSGGLNGKEWLKFIDDNERNGSWRDLQKSVARGARTHKEWSSKGVPTKVTRDNHYYFEFRKDGKWYFAGVVGD